MAYPYSPYAAFFPPPMDFGRQSSRSSRRSRSRSRSRDRQRSSRDLQDRNGRTGGDSERTAQTVFISGLHPKVDDVEIFELFSNAGRVDDVQLIRDTRTNKSKGLAYVEMSCVAEAHKAALLHGQQLGGFPINVTVCVPKGGSSGGKGGAAKTNPDGLRLYVGSLHYNISESDLTPIFDAFGAIDGVEVHRDANTATSKGFAFVSFRKREDGETAMQALDGYEIAGRPIKVSYANPTDGPNSKNPRPQEQLASATAAITAQHLAAVQPAVAIAAAPAPLSAAQLTPSACVLVSNMFNPAEETEAEWARDLAEDVEEEVTKFGPVTHLHVDSTDPSGLVYLRFTQQDAAVRAQKALHGRWFANRQLKAEFVTEADYNTKFPTSQKTDA